MKTRYLIAGLIIYFTSSTWLISQSIDKERDKDRISLKKDLLHTNGNTEQTADVYFQNDTFTFVNTGDTLLSDSLNSNVSLVQSEKFISDSVFYMDSLEFVRKMNDTLPKKSKTVITSQVETSADDSTIFSIDGKKVFLFGNAKIVYEDITIEAAYIEVDMDEGIMYAEGYTDTVTGEIVGEPYFTQGDQAMKAKTITYNLNTEKGYIKGLYTEQDEGYLHSNITKKSPDNSVNLSRGKFTTCELEHPHFYLSLSRAKMVPDKAIVSSYAYMVIEDIPLYPIFIPFGYFPSTRKKASGFIIPTFGDEEARGFYLQRGGYYFALSDYADLTLTGDIYSKGSWQLRGASQYKLRYKYTGNVDIGISKMVLSEFGLPDYRESQEYRVVWNHSQDPKARPNSNFSASVNFRSMGDNRYNESTADQRLSQTISSSISYRKTFANTPFSMTANLRHTQNMRDSTMTLVLPQMTMNMSRVFPFRKKIALGKQKWYEKIGVSYTGNYENKATFKDTLLFKPQMLDQFEYGLKHSVPIGTSFKLLKYMSINPTMSFTDRMYFRREVRDYSTVPADSSQMYTLREESGFYNLYDFSVGVGFNTKIYGMYQYKNSKVKAIRHVVTPGINFSYRPDFSDEIFGFYLRDTAERTGYYNPYINNAIYGVPGTGKSGSVGFSLNNNIEMKVLSKKDTVTGEKKIKLLDALNFSTSYNLMADSMNWSLLNMSARTRLFNIFDINMSATGDPYAIDSNGVRYNTFEYTKSGKIVRLTRFTASTGISFKSTDFKNDSGKDDDHDDDDHNHDNDLNQLNNPYYDPLSPHNDRVDFNGYDYFEIPWNVSINYNVTYTKSTFTPKIIQTASFSGDFSLTPKWKINFRSGWDFEAKKLSYTSFNLSRDLHCWVATVSVIPFGQYQSYNFTIGIKSGMLRDIKYTKNKSWMDNTYGR